MRSLFLVAAVSALAWARPETYKETEDFQYARSSSDEGSKSGYYGAQRGNVAGNYERAHNMDGLAQHQMSSAVSQVEGELGDAANTRTGNVYTAANSRGVYGSGKYDLSNLQGRNFGEGASVDSSRSSMSSAYNQHLQNSDWRSQSQRAEHGATSQLGKSSLHAGSLHAEEDTSGYGTSNLEGSHSHSSGYHAASGYHSQSGYNSQNIYDQNHLREASGSYGAQAGDQSRRYTIVTPVRVVGRPGAQIAVPVYGQAYNTHRASSLLDQNSSNRQSEQSAASRFDQNAINSEAEILNNNQQHITSVPVSDGKHYSSSYNYRKAWERHSETTGLPVPVTLTESPIIPKNSELHEDALSNLQETHSQNSLSGNAYNSADIYNQAHSAQSVSSHQSDYKSQHRSQSEANSNAYTQGTYGSHSGLSSLVDSQPKSYQSSYSYHKSWEKQGDPYVIVPATNGEASQRLSSGNTKTSAYTPRYGSHQHSSQGAAVDCDSLCRYRRATRSARSVDYYQQNQEALGQQAQTGWEENLSQQAQQQHGHAKLEDLGQHAQQPWGNLQDLGQQTQKSWGNIEEQQRPQKLEDLGQQTQQSLDNLQQHKRPEKLEYLGQQTQLSWDNLQQQHRPQKLEDLGQQTQGKWQLDRESESRLEDLGQQTQHTWDKSNTERQSSRENLEDLSQQTQGQWDSGIQQTQKTFDNLDNLGQKTQNKWDNLESLGQQTQQIWNTQQTEALGQQAQNNWDDLDNLGQQVQTQWHNINTINKTRHSDTTNTEQQTQTHFESVDEIKPNREHAEDNIYVLNKDNSNYNNPDNPAFWGLTDEQKHESHHYHSSYNHNSYSNSQSHGTNWGHEDNYNNAKTTHNKPLQSLWDKVDNMEEQSEHSTNKNQQEYEISQHSYGHESTYYHESNWDRKNSSHHHETNSGYQPPIVFNTVDKPKNDQLHNEAITEKPKDDDLPEEPETVEIGRGDIGAEDESAPNTIPKTLPNSQTFRTHVKPDKTSEEIEALSLSRGTENATNSLSVLSISQQKWLDEQRIRAVHDLHQVSGSGSTTNTGTTSQKVINGNTTPKSNVHNFNHQKNNKHSESGENLLNTNIHYGDHKPTPKNRLEQPEGIKQHNNTTQSDKIENNYYNLQQQNTAHQLDEPEKQTQDLNQQHLQEFSNSEQHRHNIGEQNTAQLNQDSSQQNLEQFSNLEQHNHSTDKHDIEKQLQDFGQQSQDLSQQNLQHFTNLGLHSHYIEQQNTGQQLQDFFGQQNQDLSQQNLQQFTDLEQHGQNFDQQNTGQQLEDFGQQNQDLNQQDLQPFTNWGQHSQNFDQENAGQQLEDFGQQSQDLNQQDLQSSWSQNLDHYQAREFVPDSDTQIIQEESITPFKIHVSETHSKQEVEIIPPLVTTTEKPGFWKSVGNKLSSAKDSVSSWFKRS